MNQSKQETHLKLTCNYSLPLLSPFLSSCSLSCFSRYSQKLLSTTRKHITLSHYLTLSTSLKISLSKVSLSSVSLSQSFLILKKKSAPLLWGPPKKNLHQKYLPGKTPPESLFFSPFPLFTSALFWKALSSSRKSQPPLKKKSLMAAPQTPSCSWPATQNIS